MQSSALRNVMYWLMFRIDNQEVLDFKLDGKMDYLEDLRSFPQPTQTNYSEISIHNKHLD
jgi:hypothetical protein